MGRGPAGCKPGGRGASAVPRRRSGRSGGCAAAKPAAGGCGLKGKACASGSGAKSPAPAEIRTLLPRLWRHFSDEASGNAAVRASLRLPLSKLRGFLRRSRSSASRWGWTPDRELRRHLRSAARLPRLRQRLGFRFKDPSSNGSWGVDNLVGFTSRNIGGSKRRHQEVSWDVYRASYRLSLPSPDTLELWRSVGRQVVSTRVEKRRRGDPGGALAGELITVTCRTRSDEAGDRRKRIRVVRRTCDLLPAVIIRPPSGPQQWTLIYLHGLGSSALGNYSDRPHYFVDGSIALKVVVPTAPSREVSCYDGWWERTKRRAPDTCKAKARTSGRSGGEKRVAPRWRLAKFLSWYDYLSNYDGRREDSIDWQSLGATQRALHSIIRREVRELGGRASRVLVGGKSQGCCTSLDAMLTYPQALGGFVGVVGHLLSCTPVEPGGPQVDVPLYFFHEPEDTMMRWEWVQRGEKRLREAGYRVFARRIPDPAGHGHFVEGVEGAWIRSALRSICTRQR